jgi:hypothetical protein
VKRFLSDFLLRGLVALGFGPIVMAVVYLCLQKYAGVESLTVNQMCVGIISLSLLAFMVGGMNTIYKIERLPLMWAILIHGAALYLCYLVTYLVNDWLDRGPTPILIFTGVFILGYILIWAIIYLVNKSKIKRLNEMLKQKQYSHTI